MRCQSRGRPTAARLQAITDFEATGTWPMHDLWLTHFLNRWIKHRDRIRRLDPEYQTEHGRLGRPRKNTDALGYKKAR